MQTLVAALTKGVDVLAALGMLDPWWPQVRLREAMIACSSEHPSPSSQSWLVATEWARMERHRSPCISIAKDPWGSLLVEI